MTATSPTGPPHVETETRQRQCGAEMRRSPGRAPSASAAFPVAPVKENAHLTPMTTFPCLTVVSNIRLCYSVFMMQRRTDLWGPDAEEFDPDCWLDERSNKYVTKNPYIFIPFNAGPRICLGQQFVYNEMSFMIIRLLQNFTSVDLHLSSAPPDAHPPAVWAEASPLRDVVVCNAAGDETTTRQSSTAPMRPKRSTRGGAPRSVPQIPTPHATTSAAR